MEQVKGNVGTKLLSVVMAIALATGLNPASAFAGQQVTTAKADGLVAFANEKASVTSAELITADNTPGVNSSYVGGVKLALSITNQIIDIDMLESVKLNDTEYSELAWNKGGSTTKEKAYCYSAGYLYLTKDALLDGANTVTLDCGEDDGGIFSITFTLDSEAKVVDIDWSASFWDGRNTYYTSFDGVNLAPATGGAQISSEYRAAITAVTVNETVYAKAEYSTPDKASDYAISSYAIVVGDSALKNGDNKVVIQAEGYEDVTLAVVYDASAKTASLKAEEQPDDPETPNADALKALVAKAQLATRGQSTPLAWQTLQVQIAAAQLLLEGETVEEDAAKTQFDALQSALVMVPVLATPDATDVTYATPEYSAPEIKISGLGDAYGTAVSALSVNGTSFRKYSYLDNQTDFSFYNGVLEIAAAQFEEGGNTIVIGAKGYAEKTIVVSKSGDTYTLKSQADDSTVTTYEPATAPGVGTYAATFAMFAAGKTDASHAAGYFDKNVRVSIAEDGSMTATILNCGFTSMIGDVALKADEGGFVSGTRTETVGGGVEYEFSIEDLSSSYQIAFGMSAGPHSYKKGDYTTYSTADFLFDLGMEEWSGFDSLVPFGSSKTGLLKGTPASQYTSMQPTTYAVPVSLKRAETDKGSMAAATLPANAFLSIDDAGKGTLRLFLGSISMSGSSYYASDLKVYSAAKAEGETTNATVLSTQKDQNGNDVPLDVEFAISDDAKATDYVYVNMYVDAMQRAVDARVQLDYVNVASAASSDIEAASKTNAAIAELPAINGLSLADKDKVTAARTSYNALTDIQKSFVHEAALIAAESQITSLEATAANQTAADKVIAAIKALPAKKSLKLSDKSKVQAARKAYGKLTSAQQTLVTNLSTLTAAENQITALEKTDDDAAKNQKLSGGKSSVSKAYGAKAFSLGVKSSYSGATLTYKSSNQKVATVDKAGKVTVKAPGVATITITSTAKSQLKKTYTKTFKTKVTVTLSKPALTKATKSAKKGQVTAAWGKISGAQGYEVKVGSKSYTVKGAKTLTKTVSAAKGKNVKVQVRAYSSASGEKAYSAWSAAKTVKVKK